MQKQEDGKEGIGLPYTQNDNAYMLILSECNVYHVHHISLMCYSPSIS